MVRGIISDNYSYSYIKNGFQIKNVMISKRMVILVRSLGLQRELKGPTHTRKRRFSERPIVGESLRGK